MLTCCEPQPVPPPPLGELRTKHQITTANAFPTAPYSVLLKTRPCISQLRFLGQPYKLNDVHVLGLQSQGWVLPAPPRPCSGGWAVFVEWPCSWQRDPPVLAAGGAMSWRAGRPLGVSQTLPS